MDPSVSLMGAISHAQPIFTSSIYSSDEARENEPGPDEVSRAHLLIL